MNSQVHHTKELQRHCRICARIIVRYKYNSTKNADLLRKAGIDVRLDSEHIHPLHFCGPCCNKVKKVADGRQVQTSLKVHLWTEHKDDDCTVCQHFNTQKKGGRPTKQKGSGRPCEGSGQSVANCTLRNAPPSMKATAPLSLTRFLPPTSVSLHDVQCSICNCIVDRPVETACGKLLCSVCIAQAISSCDLAAYICTSCQSPHTQSCYPAASEVVMKVLGSLLLTCDEQSCSEVVALKDLRRHVESGCKVRSHTFSPSQLTVSQVSSQPLTSPPTTAEKRAASNVVKRLLHATPQPGPSGLQPVIKLPTAGQVRNV